MTLELSMEQATALKKALDTYGEELDRELAHTDKHELQHALRLESDRLAEVRGKVAALLEDESGRPGTLVS